MLEGVKRDKPSKDKCLPITSNILQKLLATLPFVCANKYEQTLFTATYTISYFGLIRVSEVTVDSKQPDLIDSNRTLHISDLIRLTPHECEIQLKITKTNQTGPPTLLHLSSIPNCSLCPVSALKSYTSMRPSSNGPLFIHLDLSPLTRYQFTAMLKKTLCYSQIPNAQLYKSHSFSIGCSSQGGSK